MILSHEDAARSVGELASLIAGSAGITIDVALAQGKRLPVTKLSEEVGKALSIDKNFCYIIISKYIVSRGDLHIKMGPGGGIERKVAA